MTKWEHDARHAKATKLADLFQSQGATPEQIENLDSAGWSAAEQLAGVKKASGYTRSMVVRMLRIRSIVPAEHFAGFPTGTDPMNPNGGN